MNVAYEDGIKNYVILEQSTRELQIACTHAHQRIQESSE